MNPKLAALAVTLGVPSLCLILQGCGAPAAPDNEVTVRQVEGVVNGGGVLRTRRNMVGIYRPSSAQYNFTLSRPGTTDTFSASGFWAWDSANAQAVTGRWNDADDNETVGAARVESEVLRWNLAAPGGGVRYSFTFGDAYDQDGNPTLAVAGDWNGDGIDTVGVFDRHSCLFTLSWSNCGSGTPPNCGEAPVEWQFAVDVDDNQVYDEAGDCPSGNAFQPVVGDWFGNGRSYVGLYDQNTGAWFFAMSFGSRTDPAPCWATIFGGPNRLPVVGDWDQDGKESIGYLQTANETEAKSLVGRDRDYVQGRFYLKNNIWTSGPSWVPELVVVNDGTQAWYTYQAGDLPLSGNTDRPKQRQYASLADTPLANFFPLAVWMATSGNFPIYKTELHINTIDTYPDQPCAAGDPDCLNNAHVQAWTAEANAHSLKVIRRAQTNNPGCAEGTTDWDLKGYPVGDEACAYLYPAPALDAGYTNLLAWSFHDEADCIAGDGSAKLPALRNYAAVLHAASSTRPVVSNFFGGQIEDIDFDASGGPGDDSGPNGSRSWVYTNAYANGTEIFTGQGTGYLENLDWIKMDMYPVRDRHVYPGSPNNDLESIGRIMDKLNGWSSKPQFAVIETNNIDACGQPGPTAEQVTLEIWEAIIHGARGITYFTQGYDASCVWVEDNTPADVKTVIQANNDFINRNAAWLQGTINNPSFGMSVGYPLEVGWRNNGDRRYFIVINPTGGAVSGLVRLHLAPQNSRLIDIMNGNLAFGAYGQPFTLSMAPYQVRVFVYGLVPTLDVDQVLNASDAPLRSLSGKYRLLLQDDGNLSISDPTDYLLWTTNPKWPPGNTGRLIMQGDGNLVVCDSSWSPVWAAGTNCGPPSQPSLSAGSFAELGDDGILRIYNPATDHVLWYSGLDGNPNGHFVQCP
jgi:hypothetical protein